MIYSVYSKSTFAQDSRVLIPHLPLFVLVRFRAPLPPTKVRSLRPELTLSPSISISRKFRENINDEY